MPKSSHETPVQTISYNAENSTTAITDAIESTGACFVTDLPPYLVTAVTDLYDYGDNAFDRIEEGEIKPGIFPIEQGSTLISGTSQKSEGKFFCYWGNRIFISLRGGEKLEGDLDKVMDFPGSDHAHARSSFGSFYAFSQVLFNGVLGEVESRFSLEPGALKKDLCLGDAAIGLTRYIPVTRRRIQETYEDGKLCLADGSETEITAFAEHTDYTALTLLTYRGNKTAGVKTPITRR